MLTTHQNWWEYKDLKWKIVHNNNKEVAWISGEAASPLC